MGCSKEVVNRMIVKAKRRGRKGNMILLVGEDEINDIKLWNDDDIDPAVRKEIFEEAAKGNVWGVTIIDTHKQTYLKSIHPGDNPEVFKKVVDHLSALYKKEN
jgi:hypothetical protein